MCAAASGRYKTLKTLLERGAEVCTVSALLCDGVLNGDSAVVLTVVIIIVIIIIIIRLTLQPPSLATLRCTWRHEMGAVALSTCCSRYNNSSNNNSSNNNSSNNNKWMTCV